MTNMDIDERVQRIAENTELLQSMMRDVLTNVDKLAAKVDKLAAKVDKLTLTSQTHDAALTRLENMMVPLVQAAVDHEQRLRKIESENGEDTDEGEVTT